MTETILKEIVHRAVRDGSYRAQLQSDPAGALAGFSLTAEERSAITSGDPTRLMALGIDQRMSKAFGAGVLGDASKVIVIDAGAGGGSVIDEATGSVMQPVWRIERDLDTVGAAALDPSAQFDATGLRPLEREADSTASVDEPAGSSMTPVWRVEQDLDTASSEVKDIDWPGEDHQTNDARAEDTAGAQVTDLNQDVNWDGAQLTDY